MKHATRTWAALALAGIALTAAVRARPDAPDTGTGLAQDTAQAADPRALGRRDAPVTIYEMSDFQCPFCRRHALETFPILEREYIATGKVRYVFINFPISQLHPNAEAAAELGLCAARQGKFWPLHDLLFRKQEAWAPLKEPGPYLLGLADSVGLDHPLTVTCLAESAIRRAVEEEAQASMRAGATATPSFYIEGGLLVGAQPIQVFRTILDSIVASKASTPTGRRE
ncbi:MAG TPA: thioredoxin domain-containing protein [Gemmatimonadales bacterium]|nr:thioredoxin domain-containing protein [Gemmatimonadales bacterium]